MTSFPADDVYHLDWSSVAFSQTAKKSLKELQATFIAAPREMSAERFKQLVKQYLPLGPIMLGLSKDPFVAGFEGQPQFKTLSFEAVRGIVDKVNASRTPHRIYTLAYFQREAKFVFGELRFRRAVLVNGSWKYAFHVTEPFYALIKKRTPYELVSPFAGENEARRYEQEKAGEISRQALEPWLDGPAGRTFSEKDMLTIAAQAAKLSYDYCFQTGTALGRPGKAKKDAYTLLAYSYNKVVPFQTHAMHYGAARETHFSPPHDLNHYDTVHAEVELLISAQKQGMDLGGSTLFINLLPCPACSRMLADTDIAEIIYTEDHSAGYAIKLFEAAGKRVRRLVP